MTLSRNHTIAFSIAGYSIIIGSLSFAHQLLQQVDRNNESYPDLFTDDRSMISIHSSPKIHVDH